MEMPKAWIIKPVEKARGKIICSRPEELIYCEDCIHRDPEDKRCDHGRWYSLFPCKDDDYCSYGMRREKDE